MRSWKFLRREWWVILIIGTALIVLFGAVALMAAPPYFWRNAEAQTEPPPTDVSISWTEAGLPQSAGFTSPTGVYIIGVRDGLIQVGWSDPALSNGYGEILLTADESNQWWIGQPNGDINGNGNLDFADVVELFHLVLAGIQ